MWLFTEGLLYSLSIVSGICLFCENVICQLKTRGLNKAYLKVNLYQNSAIKN